MVDGREVFRKSVSVRRPFDGRAGVVRVVVSHVILKAHAGGELYIMSIYGRWDNESYQISERVIVEPCENDWEAQEVGIRQWEQTMGILMKVMEETNG